MILGKRLLSLSLFFLFLMLFFPMAGWAVTERDSEEDIKEVREFIEGNKPLLIDELSDLDKNSSLEEIEATIQNFYSEKSIPTGFYNPEIDITDVYPNLNTNQENNEVINFNAVVASGAQNEGNETFVFETDTSTTEVVVYSDGSINILEHKTISSNDTITALSTTTPSRRTTGIAYNSLGMRMITVWAEGQFNFNGRSVSVARADGDWTRHTAGSQIQVSQRARGATRNVLIDGHRYAEVYTRLYLEANFAFRWSNVTMASGTVEVHVGSTVNGRLYGASRVIR